MQIVTDHGIGPRAADLPYELNAPGLYPDETVCAVDGRLAGVSVELHWLAGGQGVAFHAYARLLEPDGRTLLAGNGAEVECAVTYNASSSRIAQLTVAVIARELTHAVLGLPQTRDEAGGRTLLMLSDEAIEQASIRHAIAALATIASGIDVAGLLPAETGE